MKTKRSIDLSLLSDFELMDAFAEEVERSSRRNRNRNRNSRRSKSEEYSAEELTLMDELRRRGILKEYKGRDGRPMMSFSVGVDGGSGMHDDCPLCREMAEAQGALH